jgi:hypothetical protein
MMAGTPKSGTKWDQRQEVEPLGSRRRKRAVMESTTGQEQWNNFIAG